MGKNTPLTRVARWTIILTSTTQHNKGNKMITIKLTGTNPAKWLASAYQLGRHMAEKEGVAFKDTHITVTTPEAGRCLEKLAGAETFTAHG